MYGWWYYTGPVVMQSMLTSVADGEQSHKIVEMPAHTTSGAMIPLSEAHIFALCESTHPSIIWAWWYNMLSKFEFGITKMLRGTFGALCGMQISHITSTNKWITIWWAMWRGSEILLDSEATVVWCLKALKDSDLPKGWCKYHLSAWRNSNFGLAT